MIHNQFLAKELVSKLDKNKLCIFLFHGVINKNENEIRNYTGKHIESNIFKNCMEELKRFGNPISMDEVLDIVTSKRIFEPFSFAISFDDGFENNLSIAAPILKKLSIPFIIYLTTNFIEINGMSWTDKIEYALEKTSKLEVFDEYMKKTFLLRNKNEKIKFLKDIRQLVKNNASIDAVLYSENLQQKLEVDINESKLTSALDKKISWEQIQQLKNDKLITFGGHSHTHRILSFLSKDELCFELDTSLKLLKEKGGLKSTHYSYPEGLHNSYSDLVINEMTKRGIRCCPTAINGINTSEENPFELKRIIVG